jgi:TonB family protein
MKLWSVLAVLSLASAQTPISRTFPVPTGEHVSVTGAPYSGEVIQEHVQTLADGTHVAQQQVRKIFRDGQGRERIELPLALVPEGAAPAPLLVEITDPVAGFVFTLDTEKKIAHRRVWLVASSDRVYDPVPSLRTQADGRVQPVKESLGTREIDGVSTEGLRQTVTIPAGLQGNDRPMVTTLETWTSPELKVTLLFKSESPVQGSDEVRYTNLIRSEPSPDLFRLTPDYTVVEETGAFTIRSGPPAPGAVSAPVAIKNPPPQYTQEARKAGIEGFVRLVITVGADGIPFDIRVVRSLDPGLDKKAIEAVNKWRFRPGEKDGKPVNVQAMVEVNFKLLP